MQFLIADTMVMQITSIPIETPLAWTQMVQSICDYGRVVSVPVDKYAETLVRIKRVAPIFVLPDHNKSVRFTLVCHS
jgi:hypothetical protein